MLELNPGAAGLWVRIYAWVRSAVSDWSIAAWTVDGVVVVGIPQSGIIWCARMQAARYGRGTVAKVDAQRAEPEQAEEADVGGGRGHSGSANEAG